MTEDTQLVDTVLFQPEVPPAADKQMTAVLEVCSQRRRLARRCRSNSMDNRRLMDMEALLRLSGLNHQIKAAVITIQALLISASSLVAPSDNSRQNTLLKQQHRHISLLDLLRTTDLITVVIIKATRLGFSGQYQVLVKALVFTKQQLQATNQAIICPGHKKTSLLLQLCKGIILQICPDNSHMTNPNHQNE
ncbi:hypothetical protein ACJMK2_034455 [Sinanodonta woodiana]|uniref:Uncharacterized protein n=1 Tax=Sinanodonta woodiana TaxID=1069815 RepID=A0ABD3WRP2_SINWO